MVKVKAIVQVIQTSFRMVEDAFLTKDLANLPIRNTSIKDCYTDYLFTAQYIVEAKQILDDCNHFIWRQKPGTLTAGQAKDHTFVSQCLRKDKAYRFMKNVRGSPPRTFYEMLAMIRQLGTPTWFFSLSAADLKWPARQYGVAYTDEQVAALSFEEKCSWIRRNPVTAGRHFQYRLNTFFNEFLKSPASPE